MDNHLKILLSQHWNVIKNPPIYSLPPPTGLYFEEVRNILINQFVNFENIIQAFYLNLLYLSLAIFVFYYSFDKAREEGTLINIGE